MREKARVLIKAAVFSGLPKFSVTFASVRLEVQELQQQQCRSAG